MGRDVGPSRGDDEVEAHQATVAVVSRSRARRALVAGLFVLGAVSSLSALSAAGTARAAGVTGGASGIVAVVGTPDGQGYWLASADGRVLTFGDATFYGAPFSVHPNRPIVGMAATADGHGYWLVGADGGIYAYGDAAFYGSTGSLALNQPVVGMAATADGHGYWLVAADGGIFAFGDAPFEGSTGSLTLNRPVVGMAVDGASGGYWLVASDGGIFAFGAPFFGSAGSLPLNRPVVGMAADGTDGGYWLVASDGGIFAYGAAPFEGSAGGEPLVSPISSMAPTDDSGGYWLAAGDGGVFAYGDAPFFGSGAAPARIALYGDSLGMQAAQDFQLIAALSGADTLLRAESGWAPCDELGEMQTDVATWHPSVAVLEFAGNNFTACMAGYTVGTAAYYARYQADITSAIATLRSGGASVILIGVPLDYSASLSANAQTLNTMYASIAAQTPGVSYIDAGQAVLADGQFTWTLPCLSGEQCTGPDGTNVVRSPDGVHFCPDGNTTQEGPYDVCDVYSSGAWRFAMAMVQPALGQ